MLTLKLENDMEKVKKQITCLEWQLKQDLPEKDRKIFEESLKELKEHLNTLEDKEQEDDDRKRYEITCPHCGEVQYVCKSILHELGVSRGGYASCLKCGGKMNLVFDYDSGTMTAKKW